MGDEVQRPESPIQVGESSLTLDIARRRRIEEERAYYLSDEGFLDFVRDSGAAPDAQWQPHGRYCQDLITWEGEPDPGNPEKIQYRWKLVLWPRGSYKSSVFDIGQVCWLIAKDPNIRILVCSETGRQARKFVRAAMRIIDSQWFRELFGVHKGREWTPGSGQFISALRSEEYLHEKEPTLASAGVGEVQTGSHWDYVFLDDVVSRENTKTPESLDSTWEWAGEILAQLDPGCRLFIIGTLHHFDDIYCRIQDRPELVKDFDVSVHAWKDEETGELFFPSVLTDAFIARQKAFMSPRMFACFYLNKPISADEQIFKPEYFRVIPDDDVPRNVWTYLLTDFAFVADDMRSAGASRGRSGHDRTAFWVVALDANRVAYVLDFWVGRWKASDSVRIACTLWERFQRFNMKGIVLEETTYSEVLSSVFEEVRRQTFISPKFIRIPGRSQEIKDLRIESSEPRWRRGDIWFAYSLREQTRKWKPLVKEVTQWPFAGHDDILDAQSDLDKQDRDGRWFVPAPPADWQAQRAIQNRPNMVNGRYNPDRGYDPRVFTRAAQQEHDLWRIESPDQAGDDPFNRRLHEDNIWRL